jgi:IclR family pca regulon transcriptional regulator
LPRLTAHTTTDPKRLRDLVAGVREQDWCVASEEHELGVHALAVPLRNLEGRVVAALNVVTSSSPTTPMNCWRACARCCAAVRGAPSR